jgi:hypothetical protein
MRVRLRVAAAVTLGIGVLSGIALIRMRRLLLSTAVDCVPPAGYTGGGYRCSTMGYPYGPLGVALVLLAVIASLILWRLSYRRSAASSSVE